MRERCDERERERERARERERESGARAVSAGAGPGTGGWELVRAGPPITSTSISARSAGVEPTSRSPYVPSAAARPPASRSSSAAQMLRDVVAVGNTLAPLAASTSSAASCGFGRPNGQGVAPASAAVGMSGREDESEAAEAIRGRNDLPSGIGSNVTESVALARPFAVTCTEGGTDDAGGSDIANSALSTTRDSGLSQCSHRHTTSKARSRSEHVHSTHSRASSNVAVEMARLAAMGPNAFLPLGSELSRVTVSVACRYVKLPVFL